MKLKLPLALLQILLASFLTVPSLEAVTLPLPDISSGDLVNLSQQANEYVLNQNYIYTNPVSFFMRGESTIGPAGSVSFSGQNHTEILSFSNITTTRSIALAFAKTGATLSFKNLGGMSLINTTTTFGQNSDTVVLGAGSEGAPARLEWDSINGDVTLSNNKSDASLINISAVNMYADATKAGMSVTNITGNFTMDHNEAQRIIYINSLAAGTREAYTVFSNIGGKVSFSHNTAKLFTMAGVITSDTSFGDHSQDSTNNITFSDITGGVSFTNNKGGHGGAIGLLSGDTGNQIYRGDSQLLFQNIQGEGVVFQDNSSAYHGGAIYVMGTDTATLSMTNISQINFSDNLSNTYSVHSGGAIMMRPKTSLTFTISAITGDVKFSGNKTSKGGGALYLQADQTSSVSFDHIGGDLSFEYNTTATSSGGALYVLGTGAAHTVVISDIGGNVRFRDNQAIGANSRGGAIFISAGTGDSGGSIDFFLGKVSGNTEFSGNSSTAAGGAIAMYAKSIKSVFSADGGNITFSGNTSDDIANAMYIRGDSATLDYRARDGKSINFYDPVSVSVNISAETHFNRTSTEGDEYTGTILFSGKNFNPETDSMANMTSDIQGPMTLHNGTLIVKDHAMLGSYEVIDNVSDFSSDSFNMVKGILEMRTNGTLAAKNISLSDSSILRTGSGATMIADSIDFSKGVIFDFVPFMEKGDSGLTLLATDSVKFGGNIKVHDTQYNVNYYYADNRWATEQQFLAISLGAGVADITEGDFLKVLSLAESSDKISSPYTYQGTWGKVWKDSDGDGKNDTLYVVWTPKTLDPENPPVNPPAIEDILPELNGSLAMNSMWSSAANMAAISGAALGQIGETRFRMEPGNSYWARGLGSFTHHGSEGTIDGYDYNGGGYAIGSDRQIGRDAILGIAFGNLYGQNTGRAHIGQIDQTTCAGLLYGAWRHSLSEKDALLLSGTAGYGWTENKMESFHTGGWSYGNWENKTLFASLKGEWAHNLQNNWTFRTVLGLEYTQVDQDAFTENGWDTRHFDKGQLNNLSLPVGVGFTKTHQFKNGQEWINQLIVSYVPDVYRENPSAQATRLMNNYQWTAKGSSPDRNAVRANLDSAYILDSTWTLYAAYQFEGREKAVYHQVNAGVSASF